MTVVGLLLLVLALWALVAGHWLAAIVVVVAGLSVLGRS